MVEVRWSEQALEDLDAICLFIARDAPMAARMFCGKAFDATDKLEIMPRMGPVVPEYENEAIRELFMGNYRLIYHYDQDLGIVEILTMHHGARILKLEPPEQG